MKTILYIISSLAACGPNHQLLGLLDGLDQNTFKPVILTLSPEGKDSIYEEFRERGCEIDSLCMTRLHFGIAGIHALRRYLRRVKPDLIHTQGVRADFAVSRMRRYRKIHCMTLRNYIYEDYTDQYGRFLGQYLCLLHYRAIKSCRYPICCSKSLSDKYESLFGRTFMYVRNGADEKKYCLPGEDIRADKINFVMSGSLISRKDPLLVIDAFERAGISEKAELHILGDGRLREECLHRAKRGVIFHGRVRDTAPYLQRADYCLSAAHSEGLPNSILEAGLCGCRLIVSDIPQHREITDFMEDSDKALFGVRKTAELEECFKCAAHSRRAPDRMKIRSIFLSHFSSTLMSSQYNRIYRQILAAECRDKKQFGEQIETDINRIT